MPIVHIIHAHNKSGEGIIYMVCVIVFTRILAQLKTHCALCEVIIISFWRSSELERRVFRRHFCMLTAVVQAKNVSYILNI